MAVVFKLAKNKKVLSNLNYRGTCLLFEGQDTISMENKTFNKNTLVQEDRSKMPNTSFSYISNDNNINTRTRKYNKSQDFRQIGGILPYKSDETLFENEIKFEDGTSIVASNSEGHSSTMLYQYQYDSIIKSYEFTNGLGNTPLVKMNEGSFIVVTNNNNLYNGGLNSYAGTVLGIEDKRPYVSSSIRNFPYTNSTSLANWTLSFYDSLSSSVGSASTIAGMSMKTTAYNNVMRKDHISLFDKNLNFIKEIVINGEILNIIDRTVSGKLIVVWQRYTLGSTTYPGLMSELKTSIIDNNLIQTDLSSDFTRFYSGHTDFPDSTLSFYPQIPHYDKLNKKLYYIDFKRTNNSYSRLCSIDIDLLTETAKKSLSIIDMTPKLSNIHVKVDFGINLMKTSLGSISKNNKKYFYLYYPTTSFGKHFLGDFTNRTSITSTASYQSGMVYMGTFFATYQNSEFPLQLFSINEETQEIVLHDSMVFNKIAEDEALRAIFPVGDEFLLAVKDTGLWLYGIDANEKFVLLENITDNIGSVGVDDNERVWFARDNDSFDIEMISPYLSSTVYLTFEQEDLTYAGNNIESNVIVEAKNMADVLQEVEIKLSISGNAIFRETQNKSITLLTSNLTPLKIPFVITGSGNISIYTSYEK